MFAEEATISGWQFFNNYIKSSNNWVALNGNASTDSIPFLAAGNNYGVFGWDSSNGRVNPNATLRMYPTGIIRIGNNNSMAGISGAGDDSNQTRFWAGDADRDHAPFMVKQSGALHATNATITGNVTTDTLTVRSRSSWYGPGVICICYWDGRTRLNVYSVGGKQITGISNVDNGTITINHNVGHTNYVAFAIGSERSISTSGAFIGSSNCTDRSTNSCRMSFIDTDNDNHRPGLEGNDAVDIIILAYQ